MEISFRLKNANFKQTAYVTNVLNSYGVLKTYETFLNINKVDAGQTDRQAIETLVDSEKKIHANSLEDLLKQILDYNKKASVFYFNFGGEGNLDKLFSDNAKVYAYVNGEELTFSFEGLEKMGLFINDFDHVVEEIVNIVGVVDYENEFLHEDEFEASKLDKSVVENLKKADKIAKSTVAKINRYNGEYTRTIVNAINSVTQIVYNPKNTYEDKTSKIAIEMSNMDMLNNKLNEIDKFYTDGFNAMQDVVGQMYKYMSQTSTAVDKDKHANLLVTINQEIEKRKSTMEDIAGRIAVTRELIKIMKQLFENAVPSDEEILIYKYHNKQLDKILDKIANIDGAEKTFVVAGFDAMRAGIDVVIDFLYRDKLQSCLYKVPYVADGVVMVTENAEEIEKNHGTPPTEKDKKFVELLKQKRFSDIKADNIIKSFNNILENLSKFAKNEIKMSELTKVVKTYTDAMSKLIDDLEALSIKNGQVVDQLITLHEN